MSIYVVTVLVILGSFAINSPGDISSLLIAVAILYPLLGVLLLFQFGEPLLLLLGITWVAAITTIVIGYFRTKLGRLGIIVLTIISLAIIIAGVFLSKFRLNL
jgi:hypothetical protein